MIGLFHRCRACGVDINEDGMRGITHEINTKLLTIST